MRVTRAAPVRATSRVVAGLQALNVYVAECRRWRADRPSTFDTAGALRVLPAWLRSLRAGSGSLADGIPWLTFPAIAALERRVLHSARALEYGVGGSTLYLARRCRELVSVEHDAEWAERVRTALVQASLRNTVIHVVAASPDESARGKDPADPESYVSSDDGLRGYSLRDYATHVDRYPDAHFDLVLVDGRARPSCLEHAARKVAAGGLLILDNSERPHYRPALEWLRQRGWSAQAFPGPGPYNRCFWETTFLQVRAKP